MDGHPGSFGGWTESRLQAGSPSPNRHSLTRAGIYSLCNRRQLVRNVDVAFATYMRHLIADVEVAPLTRAVQDLSKSGFSQTFGGTCGRTDRTCGSTGDYPGGGIDRRMPARLASRIKSPGDRRVSQGSPAIHPEVGGRGPGTPEECHQEVLQTPGRTSRTRRERGRYPNPCH